MTVNPNHVHTMEVCPDCLDVVGSAFSLRGHVRGGRPLVQRGTCPPHRARPHEPTWDGFDFTRQVDLCYCCGVVPLLSGSRWSVWFCDDCKHQVGLLNGRHGRCVLPIGRHSVHWGWLLGGDEFDDPVATHLFCEASKLAGEAIRFLSDWHHFAIGRNLYAIGADRTAPTPIQEYCREARVHVDPLDRFREMCDYVDRRGRAVLAERQAEGR